MEHFRALVLNQDNDNGIQANFDEFLPSALPAGDTNIEVLYSSLNYKDGLNVTGTGRIARRFPMVPGIDLIGRVIDSEAEDLPSGQLIAINGCGLGEKHWGGYAQRARVQSEWCVPLPEAISAHHAAAIGTAGFTAMLAIQLLENNGLRPENGPVLITGATGGVGSVAAIILSGWGYDVVASTGRADEFGDYLRSLGVTEIIGRYEGKPQRPLSSRRWAGAIDNVGGDTLAHILTEVDIGGGVASVGNAGGASLETSVFPFILRGVHLLGVDSNNAQLELRKKEYQRLADDLNFERLDSITRTEPLSNIHELAEAILANKIHGRVVIDVKA